jgi:hypothetical protein
LVPELQLLQWKKKQHRLRSDGQLHLLIIFTYHKDVLKPLWHKIQFGCKKKFNGETTNMQNV